MRIQMQTDKQRAAGFRELQADFIAAGKLVLAEKAARRAAEFERAAVNERLANAVKAGQIACDSFSAAVKAAGYKSRWDRLDYAKHPALAAARDAHHAAGRELHEAFAASRKAAGENCI